MQEIVEKRPLPVRLSQAGQDPLDGYLMLTPAMGNEKRPETLLELLNCSRPVIPFIQAGDRQVVLLVRSNIGWVNVKKEADASLVFPPEHRVTHRQHVHLFFADTNRLEAYIEWDHTNPRTRLSDHLNECSDFFPVTASFGMLFVNRQRLRQMRITQPLAEPVGKSRRPQSHVTDKAT